MSVAAAIPVFCVCVAASLVASLVFGRRLDRVSEGLGASEGLHGILTALGADAPEISTAVAALVASHGDLGVGVVVGSNVFNLAALLGLSAIVAGRVAIHRHGLLFNGGVALAVTGVGVALILEAIKAVWSTILVLAVLAPYVFLLSSRTARLRRVVPAGPVRHFVVAAIREEIEDLQTGEAPRKGTRADAVALVCSLAVIVGASVGMVDAATDLGRAWGTSDIVVGTVVLASLTSLPNFLTAVRLALHGRGAAVVSEALNSNSLNILAGISIPALVLSIGSASGIETFAVWWLLGMTVVSVALAYGGSELRRREGVLIVALYVAFVVVVVASQ
jgi:cation:H+ antiporter